MARHRFGRAHRTKFTKKNQGSGAGQGGFQGACRAVPQKGGPQNEDDWGGEPSRGKKIARDGTIEIIGEGGTSGSVEKSGIDRKENG